MALVGMLVRWFESHQIAPDIGHIPVSNLYEVFVLFCWLTTLFYLYYEQRYATRALGAFVMLVVSAAVGFLLWYTVVREAQRDPAAGAGAAELVDEAARAGQLHRLRQFRAVGDGRLRLPRQAARRRDAAGCKLAPLCAARRWCCASSRWSSARTRSRRSAATGRSTSACRCSIVGGILAARRRIAARLPSLEVLDDMMYRSIAVGFAFFTIATILGAFWAAEAWGGYWSWDPKETWALIVWLNYAAWLHMRLMKGLRGAVAGLVGADRAGRHHLRLPRRQHVPVGAAFVRRRCSARAAGGRHPRRPALRTAIRTSTGRCGGTACGASVP